MIYIEANIIGAILAFGVGVFIAAANYKFSKYTLKKHPAHYAILQMVRQWIQIAYLLVIYFAGAYTPWDKIWLLVGAALGITLPNIWFTHKLVQFNQSLSRKEESENG